LSKLLRGAAVALTIGLALLTGGFPELLRTSLAVAGGHSAQCPWSVAISARAHAGVLEQMKNRILASSRAVGWSGGGLERWETPAGRFWIPPGSQYTLPFNLAEQELGLYEFGELGVRPGDVVLDCGANVGVYTRHALEAGARLVVAIEPLPENLICLRRNFATDIAADRVVLVPKGVWNREELLEMHVDAGSTAAASVVMGRGKRERKLTVPLTTIDRLVQDLNLDRVDFIKMDIEGAETNALQGAANTLREWRPRLAISSYHLDEDPVTIPAAVRSAQAQYQEYCGACEALDDRLRPVVLFYE
jgi:FkbM family methyltransferase